MGMLAVPDLRSQENVAEHSTCRICAEKVFCSYETQIRFLEIKVKIGLIVQEKSNSKTQGKNQLNTSKFFSNAII